MQMKAMIFDQYSRYKACADLLHQSVFRQGYSVLDVGSGPECLFGQFMPDAEMSYVDPLISIGSGPNRISGDVFSAILDGQHFDCVTAVDVLEHVPGEHRQAFLSRLSSLSRQTLVLGFPTADTSEACAVDDELNRRYRAVFDHDYSWLDEHLKFGLPTLTETVEQLEALGWHCKTIGHGHAPWLKELLGFTICVWDVPAVQSVVEQISEDWNHNLYTKDFRPPFYRQFVVATKHPIPDLVSPFSSISDEEADQKFYALMEKAQEQYFSLSLKALRANEDNNVAKERKLQEISKWGQSLQATLSERDKAVEDLTRKTQEMSEWGQSLLATLSERDKAVEDLTRKTQEMSERGQSLQATLSERDKAVEDLNQALITKQAELMKMSDWAFGMMQDLKRAQAPLHVKLASRTTALKQALRRKLAKTVLGDLVRHVRDSRRYRANMVSIDAIRRSLHENDGRLIITFPIITWEFRWQRPQHIVSRLRDNGYSILYLAMSIAPFQRTFRSDKEAGATLQFNNLAPHVNQIWLHSKDAVNIYTDSLEGDDLHNVVSGLRSLLAELKPKSIHYLLQFPGWWPLAEALRENHGGRIVFDCMDDHAGFSTNTAQALKTEHALIKQADLVIASSALLEDRCKALNPNTIQVKNGTEFHHFHEPMPNGELDHLKGGGPIIGYYGAISDWFDMELVAYCAKQRPQWQFVLIGATFGAELSPVDGLPNVHFLGEKPYAELPGYLAYFDVCTIPFKLIPLTLATNPVKFYEYLSAGKPVVSVNLAELLPYSDDCYLASNSEHFVGQLERALQEKGNPQKIGRRFELARVNSWDARAKSILTHPVFN
jgi:glycosyltransferase involved in cell wall biosynthesis